MNILILHDEITDASREDERDALVQAETVRAALVELGHTVEFAGCNLNLAELRDRLTRRRPDMVFNLVESLEGHGRMIHVVPSLLESLKIPYTGSDATAIFITTQKLLTKRWLTQARIPTPACWADTPDDPPPDTFKPGRYILKPVWQEASVGIDDTTVWHAETLGDLCRGIRARTAALGEEVYAEQYIDGREFNISLLAASVIPSEAKDLQRSSLESVPPRGVEMLRSAQHDTRAQHDTSAQHDTRAQHDTGAEYGSSERLPEVLPPAEIRFVDFPLGKPRIVGYAAKWDRGSFEYNNTPRSFDFPRQDRHLLQEVSSVAQQCWQLFHLRGHVRVDMRVDPDGGIWVLEVNANPCLSPDAGFAAAADQARLPFRTVVERILADARS